MRYFMTFSYDGTNYKGYQKQPKVKTVQGEIEKKLKEKLDIPVFHDDQHGTAIVVGAALINALKLAQKKIEDITVVINGAGAAGLAIAKLLLQLKVGNLILCDLHGAIYRGYEKNNPAQEKMAQVTNKKMVASFLY